MKKTIYNLIILSFFATFLFSFAGCITDSAKKETAQIFALDTVIDITAYGEESEKAVSDAKAEIYRLEELLSVTDKNSDIFAINNSENKITRVSNETYELINESVNLNLSTNGKFDITIYNTLKLWGFTTGEYRVPDKTEIESVLKNSGIDKITLLEENCVTLTKDAALDLGGIAKGYIADKAAEAMKKAGAEYGLISLGGNIRTVGEKPVGNDWIIGIRHPEENESFVTVSVKECSVITSGAYQRNFEKDGIIYHHIIDPETGKPSDSDAVSVTIIGKDGALCDAFSTAVFVGGTEYAQTLQSESNNFEYIILAKDNNIYASATLNGKLELTDKYQNLNIIYK